MKQSEKKLLQKRIRIRIVRVEKIIDKIKKLNLKFNTKTKQTSDYYMFPIDKQVRTAVSLLNSIIYLDEEFLGLSKNERT